MNEIGAGGLWLLAALALGIAELAAPGIFLVFLALAAAITGIATLVLPDLPLAAQLASFAVWSAATVVIGRRWYRDYPVATSDALLNDRSARLIGETVTVVGPGRVRVGDGEWFARGPDLPVGTDLPVGSAARVVGVSGLTLIIEPLA